MRGANSNEHAGIADFEASEAVDDGQAMDLKFRADLSADFPHLGVGHGLVGLVLEVERVATLEIIADEAVEDDHGSVFGGFQAFEQLTRDDRLAHKQENIVRDRGLLAAADGREKGNFIAG